MTPSDSSLPALLERAGFRSRARGDAAAAVRVGTALGVQLPDEFAALWGYSDGMVGDGIDLLPVSAVEQYAGVFPAGFGYVPFTDCNDSDPYVVCCLEPLRGVVAHVFHDDEPALVCRGLGRFLELVAEAREGDEVGRIGGDLSFDRQDRTAEDVKTARELVRAAEVMDHDDQQRTDALHFAAQLLGAGQGVELGEVLTLGDEHTRQAVRRRWAALGTPAADERIRADEKAYRGFLAELRQAFNAAGVRTEPAGSEGFRLEPGNVHLNFARLFADCRRPGAMAEWVWRFKERLGGNTR